jgi:hypothetical protein
MQHTFGRQNGIFRAGLNNFLVVAVLPVPVVFAQDEIIPAGRRRLLTSPCVID